MTAQPPQPEPSFSDKHGGELVSGAGAILFLFWGMLPGALICLGLLVLFAIASFFADRESRNAKKTSRPTNATGTPDWASMTPAERSAISQQAAQARWRAERNRTYLPPWRAIIFTTVLLVVVVAPFWGD